MLRTLASRWNKQKFRCYEAKIEESEKAGSRRESNPGHLACAASALPLSYDNLSMGSLLMERIFRSTPNGVLMTHIEWLPGVASEAFQSHLCSTYRGLCGAGGCPVVVAQWQSTGCTSQVSWVRFPAAACLFTFLYFRLITSKLLFNSHSSMTLTCRHSMLVSRITVIIGNEIY